MISEFETGDITDPDFIWSWRDEILLQDVRWFLTLCNVYLFGIRADTGHTELLHDSGNIFGGDGVPTLFQNYADFIGTENLVKLIENITNQDAIFFLTHFVPDTIPFVSADVVVIGSSGNIQSLAQSMNIVFAMQLLQGIQSFTQGCMDSTWHSFEDGIDFLKLRNSAFQSFDITH